MVDLEYIYTNILLDSPIKFNGVYDVQVILHPEVILTITVVVAKTDAEAQEALREFKANAETTKNKEEQPLEEKTNL